MRIGFFARLGAAVLGVSALGACGLLPDAAPQTFAVVGAIAPQADDFRNTDPNVNDVTARLYCADGYQKLDQATLPADPGSFEQWRVQCTPHSLLSSLPF
jgi:hypothetical protein